MEERSLFAKSGAGANIQSQKVSFDLNFSLYTKLTQNESQLWWFMPVATQEAEIRRIKVQS
jgi:hypothetical protein